MISEPTPEESLLHKVYDHMVDPSDARVIGHYLAAVASSEVLQEALDHVHRVRALLAAREAGYTFDEALELTKPTDPPER